MRLRLLAVSRSQVLEACGPLNLAATQLSSSLSSARRARPFDSTSSPSPRTASPSPSQPIPPARRLLELSNPVRLATRSPAASLAPGSSAREARKKLRQPSRVSRRSWRLWLLTLPLVPARAPPPRCPSRCTFRSDTSAWPTLTSTSPRPTYAPCGSCNLLESSSRRRVQESRRRREGGAPSRSSPHRRPRLRGLRWAPSGKQTTRQSPCFYDQHLELDLRVSR